jgi:BirA family transcriptional regulator, biotin operon repressor / biotin---[acetyl-CoA-carboxylase] ligase
VSASPFISRSEHLASTPSTNDIVAAWLADGVAEVCVATADEQTAGRGRLGRRWVAPPGAALLASLGFRPSWLPADRIWRLAATVSLAMADAAEEVAGLADRAIRLKWPNDLVVADPMGPGLIRKVGGVLGEATEVGTPDPRVVVGIGVNVEWPRDAFPPDLAAAMTSLSVEGGGRPVDREALLEGFLARLEARVEALRAGRFAVADWDARQLLRRTPVRLVHGTDPGRSEDVIAIGTDPLSGALVVEDPSTAEGERLVHAGEITSLRIGA